MVRAPFFDRNGMKKGAWSAEEDNKLRSYIQKYGHWNWRELPKFAGLKRCGKSCRLRWMNYLRPDVKHGNYTEEEDALIMELHEKFGNRWSMIAAKLPGRTDNEIKNHWHTHLKKRANKNRTTSDDGKDYSPGSASQSDHDHEATHNSEAEAESLQLIISSLPNMILESSLLSPTTSSSTELSAFSSSDGGSISISNMGACSSEEFCLLPCSERCEDQSSGDFWSQPFLADNSSNISNMGACASEDFSLLPCSSERCEDQSSGDFWSQPFVADNIYNQDGPQLPCDDMFFDDLPFLVDLYPLMQDWQ